MKIEKKKPHLEKSSELKVDENENFCFSLEHHDRNQGQSFAEWEKDGLLSKAMEVLKGYCKGKLISQVDGNKFTIYEGFPPEDKTKFKFPKYITKDAHWGRIHINGKSVIVGHVVRNKFYIVFLDKNHEFWIAEKKHT